MDSIEYNTYRPLPMGISLYPKIEKTVIWTDKDSGKNIKIDLIGEYLHEHIEIVFIVIWRTILNILLFQGHRWPNP